MGYDGLPGGQLLTPTGLPRRFNANSIPYNTNIVPFNSTNNAFTIVLDYKFDINYTSNTSPYSIIAGCYERRNDADYGFILYFDRDQKRVKFSLGSPTSNDAVYTRII
jgi:hypothetical protein